MTELCMRHGISRKTGYKVVRRYDAEGRAGLADKSRAPHHRPSRVPDNLVDRVLEARRAHPRWGPRKLLVWIRRTEPEAELPSHATMSRRFHELGFADGVHLRRPVQGYVSPYSGYYGPNAAWSVDFKGPLSLKKSLRLCHPFTLGDVTSRYLLRCDAFGGIDGQRVQKSFESAFEEYGLPDAIRSDNGPPFASSSLGGLSRLSIWWIRLGIRPHRIKPGRPTQNSRHERMHRTLNEECERGKTLREQQRHFEAFRNMFNHERPHDALNGKVPAQIYAASTRRYPRRLEDPSYPSEFFVDRLGTKGELRFQGHHLALTDLLAEQLIGLQRVEQQTWNLYFGPVFLGVLNPKGFRVQKHPEPIT